MKLVKVFRRKGESDKKMIARANALLKDWPLVDEIIPVHWRTDMPQT